MTALATDVASESTKPVSPVVAQLLSYLSVTGSMYVNPEHRDGETPHQMAKMLQESGGRDAALEYVEASKIYPKLAATVTEFIQLQISLNHANLTEDALDRLSGLRVGIGVLLPGLVEHGGSTRYGFQGDGVNADAILMARACHCLGKAAKVLKSTTIADYWGNLAKHFEKFTGNVHDLKSPKGTQRPSIVEICVRASEERLLA